jgi:hypothetical protein
MEAQNEAQQTQPMSRETIVGASITIWRRALEEAAKTRIDAEIIEARALLAADAKNDAARKAQATIASEAAWRAAEHAAAQSKAAGAMVDFLLGGRAR